ncbi:MAG: O-acetyl-ADP-ribose deacetylase [Bacteroidales bacterium]|nr:O-acetyl-ADP-ribose deacetylase [Bacteroidales bacterium]
MKERIILSREDITQIKVDAIINAANSKLAGGGGVDGAIHRAAGPELLAACRLLNGCHTGSAKATPGFRLPAKFVIHAVGPVWRGGENNEPQLLSSCYRTSLELAAESHCKTIAFSNISTGIYGYPKREAASIAIQTVKEFLKDNSLPEQVIFVCFDEENFRIYRELL